MTDDRAKPGAADGPPVTEAIGRRMSLREQELFLLEIIDRCRMHSPDMRGAFAGEASLMLYREDMEKLVTIQRTLEVFQIHKADRFVRDKMMRGRG